MLSNNCFPRVSQTVRSKLSILRGSVRKVSIELVAFFCLVTVVYSSSLNTNLLVYKACDPVGLARWRPIVKKCDDETAAQHVVAPIIGWTALIQQLVPIALAMAAGTWSDRYGRRRRPLIALSMAGQILADAVSLFCVIRWSVSPAVTAAAQTVALSLSGGGPMLFTGFNAYVADTTSEESRTMRFGMVNGAFSLGAMVGMLLFGIVTSYAGFGIAYALCIVLGLASMGLTFALIRDAGHSDASPQASSTSPRCWDVVSTVNPIVVIRDCGRVLTKKRRGNNSVIMCLTVLACAPLTTAPYAGELSLMYLFLRYKFGWNEIEFTIFNVYNMVTMFIGLSFALKILSHKYRLNDALIGVIASVFDLLAVIAFLIISQPWQLYLVPLLELFRGAALALTSSIASKCVASDELGSLNSVKLLTESLMKGAFIPFYNFVYNRTLETMPSAYFLISIALTAPLVFVFGTIYYLQRRNLRLHDFNDNGENKKQNTEIVQMNG